MARTRGAVGGAAGAALVALYLHAVPALAAPASVTGEAVVISPPPRAKPLSSGGSATAFSLRLPPGASCQGDSADDNYRVQSYMVPAADNPAALSYASEGPEGTGRFPLYDVTGSPFVNVQTANVDEPGGAGTIVNIATFSYAVFPPGELAPGRYDVGIACTLNNRTTRVWNVETLVARAPEDKPAQLRWAVPGVSSQSDNSNFPLAAALAVSLLVALAAYALVRRQRSGHRSALTTPSEES